VFLAALPENENEFDKVEITIHLYCVPILGFD